MNRTLASVPLLAVLMLALAACGPTPPPGVTPVDPRPTPTGSSTPIPLPSPSETLPPEALDPLDTVTRIVLLAESVSFCDDVACAVDGFSYDESPDVAIAKLTAVFGADPTVRTYDNSDGGASYDYWWGDGFLVYVTIGPAGDLPIGLEVGVATVAGVAIETEGGVGVGTAWTDAVAAADRVGSFAGESGDIQEAWFGTVELENGFLVTVIAFSLNGSTVTSISAPISYGTYS